MKDGVFKLLEDAGIELRVGAREYRPTLSLPGFEVKIQKPQNIIEMLAAGSRDLGFAGEDWVAELGADVVPLLKTGLDPVRLVAAAPRDLLEKGQLPQRHFVVASEYPHLAQRWIESRGLDAKLVQSYGATEVFPPEDADLIVDITQTGSTLRANGLEIVEVLSLSSTCCFASRHALDDPHKRARIESMVLVLGAVLEARNRLMVEMNVGADRLEELVAFLPCMREPTIARLHSGGGFAVKVAVPRADLPTLIPKIKSHGGTDIVVTAMSQIVP